MEFALELVGEIVPDFVPETGRPYVYYATGIGCESQCNFSEFFDVSVYF